MKVEAGVELAEVRQNFWQHIRCDGWDDPEVQGAGERLAAMLCIFREIANTGQNGRGPTGHFLALWRQLGTLTGPLDQDRVKFLLKLLNLHGKRRLGNGAKLGCPPEMERLSERIEIS